jgi:hypothetical protein
MAIEVPGRPVSGMFILNTRPQRQLKPVAFPQGSRKLLESVYNQVKVF